MFSRKSSRSQYASVWTLFGGHPVHSVVNAHGTSSAAPKWRTHTEECSRSHAGRTFQNVLRHALDTLYPRDIGIERDDAQRLAARMTNHGAEWTHPTILTITVQESDLIFKLAFVSFNMAPRRRLNTCEVKRMNMAAPVLKGIQEFVVAISQYALPARGENDLVCPEIPFPRSVVRDAHGVYVSLFAALEFGLERRALRLDDIQCVA
jgi:hypothetical protein